MEAFEFSLSPDLRVLTELRHRLSAWLSRAEIGRQERSDIVLGTHEAAANAIEHAVGADGNARVTARLTDGLVTVEIKDGGSWRARSDDAAERGRGLPLIAALVDELQVKQDHRGTTVRLLYRLGDRGRAPNAGLPRRVLRRVMRRARTESESR